MNPNSAKHLTVGTAGHVDHGKTALVKALTGIDTDRLPEEKARGISIALGFSYLELKGGTVDLIDVPGHERFVKTMVAGATGLDALLLVVAADEGVMPQTTEHLEIAELLGVRQGLTVVSKSDLVPGPERMSVTQKLRAALAPTFLADAPLVFVSAHSGEGLDELKSQLNTLLHRSTPPAAHPSVYLPIDRVFTISGFGTVVTGTLRQGRIKVGDTLDLLPSGLRAEVKNLQVHSSSVAHVDSGWRVALNLRGLKKDRLAAGDALVTPGYLNVARLYDAELHLLKSAPRALKNAERVRLLYGTTEVLARVRLLEQPVLAPGERGAAQVHFGHEVAAPFREPFVLRGASPLRTLGGGLLLGPQPHKHRRFSAQTAAYVRALAAGSVREVAWARVTAAGAAGSDVVALGRDLGLSVEQVQAELNALSVTLIGRRSFIASERYKELTAQVLREVAAFHAEHPTRYGPPKEALRALLPPELPDATLTQLFAELTRDGRLEAEQNLFKLPEHDPGGTLPPEQERLVSDIEAQFRRSRFHPPELFEVLRQDTLRGELYHLLVRRGRLVPTKDKDAVIVFHRDAVMEAKTRLAAAFSKAPFTLSDAREVLGTSRKYLLPLLDYLDASGYTQRDGNARFIAQELVSDVQSV